MPQFLKTLFASRAVKRALLSLALAVAAALGYSQYGCKDLNPKAAQRAAEFACEVEALRPLVEGVVDPEDVIRGLYEGRTNMGQVFAMLKASQGEVRDVLMALNACSSKDEPEELPEGEAL